MTSFKDYLEKNSWVLNTHSDTKVITTETLGEWAWDIFKYDGRTGRETVIWIGLERALEEYPNHLELAKKNNWKQEGLVSFIISQNYFHPKKKYLEMAVACLGEEEVKKRLEELSV